MDLDKYITEQLTPYINEDVMGFMKERGGWVAGGALTSILSRDKIRDIDIYLHTKEDIYEFIHLVHDQEGGHILHFSDKSVTFKVTGCIGRESLPYHQLITIQPYNRSQDIFDHFDFTINMISWEPKTGAVDIHPDTMQHIAQRYLSFNGGTLFPFISLMRAEKYSERGYKVTKPTMMKIAMACSKKVMESWEDFREQLGGLYGHELDLEEYDAKKFDYDAAMEFLSGAYRVYKQNEVPMVGLPKCIESLALTQSKIMPTAYLSKSGDTLYVESVKKEAGFLVFKRHTDEERGTYYTEVEKGGCAESINGLHLEFVTMEEEEGATKTIKDKIPYLYMRVEVKGDYIMASGYNCIRDKKLGGYSKFYTELPDVINSCPSIGVFEYDDDELANDLASLPSINRFWTRDAIFKRVACGQEIEHIKNEEYYPEMLYPEYHNLDE